MDDGGGTTVMISFILIVFNQCRVPFGVTTLSRSSRATVELGTSDLPGTFFGDVGDGVFHKDRLTDTSRPVGMAVISMALAASWNALGPTLVARLTSFFAGTHTAMGIVVNRIHG